MSSNIPLPKHGPAILRFRYAGVRVGPLTVDNQASIPLTMDLTSPLVKISLVGRRLLMPWDLLA
jgi:hypothetical protein